MDDSFINKYKPKTLDDLYLNSELKTTINTIIKLNFLNILIVGNSGCGKTSLINIILSMYYGSAFKENKNNIMYINNLNEQGIQYFRTVVKTFCQTTKSKFKKTIVIDDIDLIYEQSQQVFRNCIDKYKNNVQFICSCTNTQKVIESIQSRLDTIKINPISMNSLTSILNTICENEKFIITKEAKNEIIRYSNYSIRILINYLEKIKLIHKEINLDYVQIICTNICDTDFEDYTLFCKQKQLHSAIHSIMLLLKRGFSVMDILDSYFTYVKFSSVLSQKEKYEITRLLCKYITIFHNIHEDEIELSLFTNNVINILNNNI
tara:strand:- start:12951 stop:13910 length:960 start_codon:yes stop_codon:yes gene_type:complete